MIEKEQVKNIVDEHLEGTEKFLVEIKVKPVNKISVYIDSDTGVTIDDCVQLSRYIESRFDRDREDFELSVSSAGFDHPLTLPRQFKKQTGKEVEVLLKDGKKISGILKDYGEEGLTILEEQPKKKKKQQILENPEKHIPFSDIKETKKKLKF